MDRGFCHVLEQIYFHLPLKTFLAMKQVNRAWRKIIAKHQSSPLQRLQLLEDQKISSAWKNENTTKVQKLSQFPDHQCTRGNHSETLSDGRHVIVVQARPRQTVLSFLNGTNFKTLKYKFWDFKFAMNANYLVVQAYRLVSKNFDDESALRQYSQLWLFHRRAHS